MWDFKAWHHTTSESQRVLWDLKRLTDPLDVLKGRRTCSKWFLERIDLWHQQWQLFDIDLASAFVRSARSQTERAKRCHSQLVLQEFTHEEFALSTLGTLTMLIACTAVLHGREQRERCKVVFLSFLDVALPADILDHIAQDKLRAADFAACARAVDGRPCTHLEEKLRVLLSSQPPQRRVGLLLLDLYLLVGQCLACKMVLKQFLQTVADHIDHRLADFQYTGDPTKATILDEHRPRKRRLDEDLKVAVARTVVADHRASSGAAFLRAGGQCSSKNADRWTDMSLLQYQSAGWCLGVVSNIVVCSADAGRSGNPAENVECFAAHCIGGGADYM